MFIRQKKQKHIRRKMVILPTDFGSMQARRTEKISMSSVKDFQLKQRHGQHSCNFKTIQRMGNQQRKKIQLSRLQRNGSKSMLTLFRIAPISRLKGISKITSILFLGIKKQLLSLLFSCKNRSMNGLENQCMGAS